MKSRHILGAFAYMGEMAEEIARLKKDRDELAKFRAGIQHGLQQLFEEIRYEPEAKGSDDLIEVVKSVLLRQRRRLAEHDSDRVQQNGDTTVLDGVRSH